MYAIRSYYARIQPPARLSGAHSSNRNVKEPSAMTVVHFDSELDDDRRRELLYAGDLFVLSPTAASRELCGLAADMMAEAFAPHDPRTAQYHMESYNFV